MNPNGKLVLSTTKSNYKLPIKKAFQFNDETEFIQESDGIKVYKNGVCTSTINPYYGEVLFHKINDDTIGIVSGVTPARIQIYSLKYNEVLYSKQHNSFYFFFHLNNDTFAITASTYTEINRIEDKKIVRVAIKDMLKPCWEYKHAILIPNTNYIAILRNKVIDIYNRDNYSLFKTVNINEDQIFNHFYIGKDNKIFLGGFKIGLFDVNNWTITIIRDDKMKRFQGHIAGVENNLNYSDIVVYSGKLICIRDFNQTQRSTYDNIPDQEISNGKDVYIFDYDNNQNKIIKLDEVKKGLNPKSIYLNNKNEVVIACSNGLQFYKCE